MSWRRLGGRHGNGSSGQKLIGPTCRHLPSTSVVWTERYSPLRLVQAMPLLGRRDPPLARSLTGSAGSIASAADGAGRACVQTTFPALMLALMSGLGVRQRCLSYLADRDLQYRHCRAEVQHDGQRQCQCKRKA
jgi:hypothetical protein